MKKTTGLTLVALLILSQWTTVFADEAEVIGRDDFIKTAIELSDARESLEDTVQSLDGTRAQLYRASQQQIDAKQGYDDATDFMVEFNIPIKSSMLYDGEDTFNYFYAFQIQFNTIDVQVQSLKNTLSAFNTQMASNIDPLFANLFNFQDMIPAQQNLVKIKLDSKNDAALKLKLGLISENDYKAIEDEYMKAYYEFDQLLINYDSLQMQVRQLMDLDADDFLKWEDSYLMDIDRTLEEEAVYTNLALENNINIKNAKLELEATEKNRKLYMESLYDMTNQYKSDLEINTAKRKLDDEIVNVSKAVKEAYGEVLILSKNVELSELQDKNNATKLKQMQVTLDQGMMKTSDFNMLVYSFDMNKIQTRSLTRQLVIALDELFRVTTVN